MCAARRPSVANTDPTTVWPWRRSTVGIIVRFRLTPRSSKSAIDGIGTTADGPAILARVNAVPEDNAANKALTDLVAHWLDCPKRSIELVGGAKSRLKTLAISGDPGALEQRLLAKSAALDEDGDTGGRATRKT